MTEPTPLELLDETLAATIKASRWHSLARSLPGDTPPALYRSILGIAVTAEDVAFEATNKLRAALGGEPRPDPANPPPVRPDE
jgi:hypothetical protein